MAMNAIDSVGEILNNCINGDSINKDFLKNVFN